MDPRAEKPLPALTRYADAQVRSWAAIGGLQWQVQQADTDALAAVLACTRDADARVREGACRALLRARADDPAPCDALAACLSDSEEAVRVTAAVQLALRDDHRGDASPAPMRAARRRDPAARSPPRWARTAHRSPRPASRGRRRQERGREDSRSRRSP
ncbi:HEAT repeat domain-containing protein [Streptomyces sp. NPDC001678]|uniref:HEAT repeat domain-containing protein n=1 Tax=Streptomyces sp. NPDC001678 TaxID=3364599 RepID=UPI0036C59B2E